MPDKPRRRTLPWTVAAISLVTLIASTYLLAKRVRAYNEASVSSLFAYIEVVNPEFEYLGRPVRITDVPAEESDGLGHVLRVEYGEDELTLPVAVEPRQSLPGLFNKHTDWMRMLFCADRAGMSMQEFEEKMARDEIDTRLIIVTRTPFGIDANNQGVFGLEQDQNASTADVRRDRWLFDFYELSDGGGFIVHQPLRFPESGKSLLRRQNNAKLKGEPIPEREAGELQERTWQYGAALKVMPRAPAITFENQALRAAGWTLPAASASVLGLVFGIFFGLAPSRVTRAD